MKRAPFGSVAPARCALYVERSVRVRVAFLITSASSDGSERGDAERGRGRGLGLALARPHRPGRTSASHRSCRVGRRRTRSRHRLSDPRAVDVSGATTVVDEVGSTDSHSEMNYSRPKVHSTRTLGPRSWQRGAAAGPRTAPRRGAGGRAPRSRVLDDSDSRFSPSAADSHSAHLSETHGISSEFR